MRYLIDFLPDSYSFNPVNPTLADDLWDRLLSTLPTLSKSSTWRTRSGLGNERLGRVRDIEWTRCMAGTSMC